METSHVRRQVLETIERARRTARERRARTEAARTEFATLLEQVVVPLCRQVAGALKAEGFGFAVNTPSAAVRLTSERAVDDYIEIALDVAETEGDGPWVVGRTRRAWGRRVLETDRPIRRCPVRDITEEDVLRYLLTELEPFVER